MVTGLDQAEYIHKRKARYMAQVLERFEQMLEGHLPAELNGDVQDFKGFVRAKMNALATDAVDLMALDGQQNGLALDFKDKLSPTGRP